MYSRTIPKAARRTLGSIKNNQLPSLNTRAEKNNPCARVSVHSALGREVKNKYRVIEFFFYYLVFFLFCFFFVFASLNSRSSEKKSVNVTTQILFPRFIRINLVSDYAVILRPRLDQLSRNNFRKFFRDLWVHGNTFKTTKLVH